MKAESKDLIKVRFRTHNEGIRAGGFLIGAPNNESFEFIGEIYRLTTKQIESLNENGFEFELMEEPLENT